MKLLGIEIERKTDILAMAAFVISLGSVIGQIAILIRGADVLIDGPRQIVLFFQATAGSRGFLNAITTQVYVNNGSPGFDDILKTETLLFELSEKTISLEAQQLVDSTRNGNKLIIRNAKRWAPAKIGAKDFLSNESLFVPYPSLVDTERDRNFVTRDEFLTLLPRSRTLKAKFLATTYGGHALYSTCFMISSDVRMGLRQKGWASLSCIPERRKLLGIF